VLLLVCDRPRGVCTDANGQATDSDPVLERDGEPRAARYHVVLPPGPPVPSETFQCKNLQKLKLSEGGACFSSQGAFGFDSMMLARLLVLLAMVLLVLQGAALKPLIDRIGEAGVLLLATTACTCYDWALAAAAAFSGQAWTAYVICALRASTASSRSRPDCSYCYKNLFTKWHCFNL